MEVGCVLASGLPELKVNLNIYPVRIFGLLLIKLFRGDLRVVVRELEFLARIKFHLSQVRTKHHFKLVSFLSFSLLGFVPQFQCRALSLKPVIQAFTATLC